MKSLPFRFLRDAQKRPAFQIAIPEFGDPNGRIFSGDSASSVGRVGGGAPIRPMLLEDSQSDSLEVWSELKRGISPTEGQGGQGAVSTNEDKEDKTWKSLW